MVSTFQFIKSFCVAYGQKVNWRLKQDQTTKYQAEHFRQITLATAHDGQGFRIQTNLDYWLSAILSDMNTVNTYDQYELLWKVPV